MTEQMLLNRRQKIVIIISILLLIISFLFPPWGDTAPNMTKFIGYSFIFNIPTHYHWEYITTTDYSEEARKILKHRTKAASAWQDNFDSKEWQDWPYTIEQEDSILQSGTFEKRQNKGIEGWATIYHQILLIEMVMIALISIYLLMFFYRKV